MTLRELALEHELTRGLHRGCALIDLLLRDALDPGFDCFTYLRVIGRRGDVDGAAARLVLGDLAGEPPGLAVELAGIVGVVAAAARRGSEVE